MESEGLRGEGHTYCEKLVWQGIVRGQRARVRIVQREAGGEVTTLTEREAPDVHDVMHWCEDGEWETPDDPLSAFVEGIIDLLGRPEWDTRAKVTSTYPLWLKVGKEW